MMGFSASWVVCLLTVFQIGSVSCLLSDVITLNYSYTEYNYYSLGNMYLNTTVDFHVDNSSAMLIGGDYIQALIPPDIQGMTVITEDVYDSTNTTIASAPTLAVSLAMKYISDYEYRLEMLLDNDGANTAGNVEVIVDLTSGLKANYISFSSFSLYNELTMIDGRREFLWEAGNMTTGSFSNDSFLADLEKGQTSEGANLYTISVTYTETTDPSSRKYGPIQAHVCINADIHEKKNILYQHGFTALGFFMGLITGMLLIVIIFFIYYMIRRKQSVAPAKVNQEKLLMERGKTIMMDENEAVRKGGHTINDYSVIGEGDSIVGVLGMKDKMQMHREIDSLDIVNTVNVDTDLEKERNDASMATTELILTSLHTNKDIDKGTLDTALSNMKKRRVHVDKQQDEDYKREMKKLYKKISAKNRAMMNTMFQKQRTEKKELVGHTQDLPPKERNDLINLMNEQHASEQNAETYKLKLEQDEETEKLRKEFAIRKRMGLKELQIQALNDVKDQGKLSDAQIKWLLNEHQKNQKSLESMYDEEISKQRMNLEEKLAKRKALAQSAETLEEDNDDLLNTVAGQQITTIEKMKKNKSISAADANQLIDEAKLEMVAIKDKMEKDRSKQENDLHTRLSALKKKRLADLSKEHEAELREYERRCVEMQTDGPIDPSSYTESRLKLLSQQRVERNKLETEIDSQQTEELVKLRSEIAIQTENELRGVSQSLNTKIQGDGDAEAMMEKLLHDHQNETEALRRAQLRNRDKQMHKLHERLEENREQWNQRREAEKLEQDQLRQYEDNVVNKLVNSQVSMSDADRERILKEHEKQMVKLENSLTLNKLRQKRMMEEKIAQRRAAQMEKLQMKQHKEKEVQKRQMENNGEESDDEDAQRKKLDLMKDHVEQKMAVLQGRKMDWDTELESIRVEMMKERSLALKEQEERLGALVAELQLSKAKELAKIEEQQKAIHNLKTNLIDDLNARGVLSDPETQAVIQRHQQEQDALNQRLDVQRLQQEKLLKEKLQMRLQQREKSMIQKQDEELKSLMSGNKTAAKIKKMLLIHNHMIAMEKMKNQLEREISQTLEQVRYEYEVCKRKAIQDQEMDFIAGLVRVGTIPKDELENVLRMLYPAKTDEEFKEIFDKIFDPKAQPTNAPPPSKEELSQLANRVKSAQAHPPPFMRRSSNLSMASSVSSQRSSLRRSSKKKQDSYPTNYEQQNYYDNDQYEEESRFRPSSRQFDDSSYLSSSKRQSFDNTRPFSISQRQPFEDKPHPLEPDYAQRTGKAHNGNVHSAIHEEDDDVVQAQYVTDDYRPAKLPPLQPTPSTGHKKKKKKKFLKKMASPRVDDDEDGF
ncbi:smoothened signaling pathway [Mactra antiquata]